MSQLHDVDTTAAADEIRRHVISLFDAYLAGDLEALKHGRTAEWKGFQIRSTRLIRGVDEYMRELERVMGGLKVDKYEFLDFEVEVEGDIALVYYLARDYLRIDDPETVGSVPPTILIRSIDVYRQLDGSWIQAGSNICAIADPQAV
ncbi:MAG: nuclear transport factor 2 family protein [Acidimicrobiia bacterium]